MVKKVQPVAPKSEPKKSAPQIHKDASKKEFAREAKSVASFSRTATPSSIIIGKTSNNLFDILNNTSTDGRARDHGGAIPSALATVEHIVSQNRQLIEELGGLLRPIMGSNFEVAEGDDGPLADVSASTISQRLYDLAENARSHNRLLVAIIEALEL